ncbi:MAG: FAD-dependent oxidoreductase [Acidobacteriota bacterium]
MIERNPALFSRDSYDLLIIGGGIYGACLSLEASRRGLSSLVLERDDFGGATSWNSLRILHGGLRYLQHLDLKRFRESVAERRWFSFWFPELVRPLPCLMPLYGKSRGRRSS